MKPQHVLGLFFPEGFGKHDLEAISLHQHVGDMEPLTKVHHHQLTRSSSDVTQHYCRLGLRVLCYIWYPIPCRLLGASAGD